jgi:hypothetical protein
VTTRGIRNNNPGNVRRTPGIPWKGMSEVQNDTDFLTFDSPEYGIRAIVRILRSYERLGLRTIYDIINRWAPPNENNSEAYVLDVCAHCGIKPDDKVSIENIMPQLVRAIIQHENGTCPYTEIQIQTGIGIA